MSTISKKIRLGDDLTTYCGKCKEERTHQVVALRGENQAERVVCRTCQSNHLYREKNTGAKRVSVRRGGGGPAELVRPAAVRTLRPYAVVETYEVEQWVSHPKFGEGKVVEVKPGGKIAVQFGREVRTLLHAG